MRRQLSVRIFLSESGDGSYGFKDFILGQKTSVKRPKIFFLRYRRRISVQNGFSQSVHAPEKSEDFFLSK